MINQGAGTLAYPVYDIAMMEVNELKVSLLSTGVIIGLQFPRDAGIEYLSLSPMFGAIRGADTAVTMEYRDTYLGGLSEFQSYSAFQRKSRLTWDSVYSSTAHADHELASTAWDTSRANTDLDELLLRPHRPIGVRSGFSSFAWKGPLTKRFVILDWWFKNINETPIHAPAIGVLLEPHVFHYPGWPFAHYEDKDIDDYDDLIGLLQTVSCPVSAQAGQN